MSAFSTRVAAVSCVMMITACGGAPESSAAPALEVPEPVPKMVVPDRNVQAFWGSAPDDLWAAGEHGTLMHFDGSAWTIVESGTKRNLVELAGSGPDDVWAVGEDVVIHFDGSSWSEVLVDMEEVLITAWSGGPNDLWAAGSATDVGCGVLRHWDGTEWQLGVTNSARTLWAVWALNASDMWTGGSGSSGSAFLAHGKNGVFDEIEFPGGSPRAIWGSAADDVWIAPYEGDFHHWNGTSFERFPRSGDKPLLGMHGTGADDIWAVGLEGTILHWDGASWRATDSHSGATFSRVWATANDVWAAGSENTLLRWDGSGWIEP